MKNKQEEQTKIENKIRDICTYYSELGEGTYGWCLSEDQFQKLFDLFVQARKKWSEELRKKIIMIDKVKSLSDYENQVLALLKEEEII